MLTRGACRLATMLGVLLTVPLVPSVTPPAHADSVAWARRLGRDIQAAQQVTKGRGVTVALLDDGVDGRIGTLRDKVERGRDFVGTPRPKKIHGTLMASFIAGGGPTHDSPFGMRGLASGVKILPVRVIPSETESGAKRWFDNGNGREQLAKGIRYAADQGAEVICAVPFFWGGTTDAIEAAVAYAYSKGAVLVAGNIALDLEETPSYPAAMAGVIGVGAVNEKGKRHREHSAKNSAVLVAAPGFELPSIGPDGSLWTFQGVATATAFVAATAALVRSEYPKLPPQLVARAITESAHQPEGGYDTEVGFGIIDPAGALKRARALEGRSVFAPASKGVVMDRAHFGGEPVTVDAVRHDPGLLAGFSGLTGAGVAAIAAAMVLAVRGRRRTTVAVGAGPLTPAAAGPPPATAGPAPPPATAGPAPAWAPGPGSAGTVAETATPPAESGDVSGS
jgi:hypothetical protein